MKKEENSQSETCKVIKDDEYKTLTIQFINLKLFPP